MSAAYPFIAMMEIVKLYLVVSYAFIPLGRPLPLFPVALSLFAALASSRIMRSAGGRLAYRVLAFALGASLSFAWTLAAYRGAWSIADTFRPGAGRELAEFILCAVAAALFWCRGFWLGFIDKRPRFCLTRFDEGVGAFIFALTIAALLHIDNAAASRLVVPFLLCSIVALGLSKAEGAARGGMKRRPRRLLVVPVAAAFALASALVFMLAPLLFSPSARLGDFIKRGLVEIEPGIVRFLRWLLGFYKLPQSATSSGSMSDASAMPAPIAADPSSELLAKLLLWALGIVAAATLAAMAGYGLYRLARLLLSKSEKRGAGFAFPRLPRWLPALFRRLARRLSAGLRRLASRGPVRSAAASAYARLLGCGRALGHRRIANETPREYAARLSRSFPRSAADAAFVVDSLEKEVYGSKALDAETERRLAATRSRTRLPAFALELAARSAKEASLAARGAAESIKARRR